MIRVECVYAVPIPVGHRVSIVWHEVNASGLFGGKKAETKRYQPIITDLVTGVEYLSEWLLGSTGIKHPDTPVRMQDDVRADATVYSEIRGTVRRCRVITIRGFAEYDVQTVLDIEPDA